MEKSLHLPARAVEETDMNRYLRVGLLIALAFASFSPSASADLWEFLFGTNPTALPVDGNRELAERFRSVRRFRPDGSWKRRAVTERDRDFLDDHDYLSETQFANQTLGGVDTRFIAAFDTRFYYYANANPDANGMVPMVDPEAKGLFVFFHGSGTEKANGGNFAVKMNKLGLLGYGSIGFDYPLHGDGSPNAQLSRMDDFAKYVHDIVELARVPGQPVYFVGHSFGPELIAEVLTRYPMLADGAALFSPGGFDAETLRWETEKTERMTKRFGEGGLNDAGAEWAGNVSRDNRWNRPGRRTDPTLVNPKLKLIVVSGEWEEYIPGPLDADGLPTEEPRTYDVCKTFRRFFSRIKCIIEKRVGHYIFEHLDENGYDVIMRTLLDLAGEDIANEKALRLAYAERLQKRSAANQAGLVYSKNLFFRKWVDRGQGGLATIQAMLREQDNKTANRLLRDFKQVEAQRYQAILDNVKRTESMNPAFYEANREQIARIGEKGFDPSGIVTKYLEMLKATPPGVRQAIYRAPEQVYALPERKIPDWVKEKMEREAAEKQKRCTSQVR